MNKKLFNRLDELFKSKDEKISQLEFTIRSLKDMNIELKRRMEEPLFKQILPDVGDKYIFGGKQWMVYEINRASICFSLKLCEDEPK